MKKIIFLSSLAIVGQVHAAKWNSSNNPAFFNPIAKIKMNSVFADLPMKASIKDDRFGWSESYWPSNLGGIAYRWNSPNPQPFKYKLNKKEEVQKMSQAELSELSPAELYDIAMGDFDYSLTKKVLKTYKPTDLWWEGICHGWSLAAANYPEPDKVVFENKKDKISVPFGASDVKGLLSMHDAFNSKGFYVRVGDKCKAKGKVAGEAYPEDGDVPPPSKADASKAECEDVNAGAFHIVLSTMIGLNSQSFVAEVDRFNDVWNQPVTSYESVFVSEVPVNVKEIKEGIDKKIQIKTVMTYGEELDFYTPELEAEGVVGFVSKDPITGTPAQTFNSKNYEYILELDRTGKIIGGEWISETRPDMLWMKAKDPKFINGKFPLEGLNQIYKPVVR